MSTASASCLRYDMTETLNAFRRRQQRAYQAGQAAWHENRIPLRLLPLYERLIRYVGVNAFTFVEVATLATEFRVHLATMKRWLSALEVAALIRRQRQFGRSSRTFITAYDSEPSGTSLHSHAAHGGDADDQPAMADATALELTPASDSRLSSCASTVGDLRSDVWRDGSDGMPLVREDRATGTATAPPAPPLARRIHAPSLSAFMRSDHNKNHPLTGGGGWHPAAFRPSPGHGQLPDTPAVAALRAIGTRDPGCLLELASQPLAEIRAACAWARRVPHPQDIGALAVHFARQVRDGLLASPAPPAAKHRGARATHHAARGQHDTDGPTVCVQCHARVVCTTGTCCSVCTEPPPLAHAEPAESRTVTASSPGMGAPSGGELAGVTSRMAIWQQACATLKASTEGADLALWLDDSELLDVTQGTAVVGTSNVFVRDALQAGVSQLARALSTLLEQAVDVLVVVDHLR